MLKDQKTTKDMDVRALSDNELDTVNGGAAFRYYKMGDNWYAVGTVNGHRVSVRVT